MSVLHLPENSMYWSKDFMFGGLFIPKVMKRDRFDKIAQYLHANNNMLNPARGSEGHDVLHHVRPIFDIVQQACKTNYNPHQNQSIDEAMIAFRGRLSFRQYLPLKPTKYGIKVWCRADPADGYLHDFQVYTGRVNNAGRREVGLASRVVVDLSRPLVGHHHIVNADNYFSSPTLAFQLLDDDIYYRGTARTNRIDFPSALLTDRDLRAQGDYRVVQRGELIAGHWRDKKIIHFLSTADQARAETTVQRRQRSGERLDIQCPLAVSEYNCYMNGVDHADQLRTAYSTYRTSRKWWKYIFWFLFDVAISNAFVLMRDSANHQLLNSRNNRVERKQLDFRKAVAKLLIGSHRQDVRQVPHCDPTNSSHFITAAPHRARCRSCYAKKQRRETKWACSTCHVNICPDCFMAYHQNLFA